MPTHVYANNNEIASKACDGKSIAAFPDVCFSPPAPPVGPMPLPYPNTGECTNTDKGTSKVFIKDKMSGMEGDSCFSKSMGDESATQNFNKGMITSALQGKCYFGLWSMNVQMEGKGVPRHLDMVTHNHASQPGQIPGANVDNMDMPGPIEGTEVEEIENEDTENKDKIHVPIIFLPGFMGSVLVNAEKPQNKVWSINNVRGIFGILGFVLGKRSTVMARVEQSFKESKVMPYKENFEILDGEKEKIKCRFNIRSTLKLLYGCSLKRLRNTLNSVASEQQDRVNEAKGKIAESIQYFSSINTGNYDYKMDCIDSSSDELQKYKFDVWGGGYNWLGSSAKSAEYIYNDLIPSIQNYYSKNSFDYLKSNTGSIQVFVITHSMGGYVGQKLEILDGEKGVIRKVIYGGIPLHGAQAFYYAAQVGLKYMISFLREGISRHLLCTIFINSQGCLELLPNDKCCSQLGKRTSNETIDKAEAAVTINKWLHIQKNDDYLIDNAISPYVVYKSDRLYGIFPFKFYNEVAKKYGNNKPEYTKFSRNLDCARLFHRARIDDLSILSSRKGKSIYLWGNNNEVGRSIGEVLMDNTKSWQEKIKSICHHPGDGTVANSAWLEDSKNLNAVTYSKVRRDRKKIPYNYTFSHMSMFSEADVMNFIAHQICESLLNE